MKSILKHPLITLFSTFLFLALFSSLRNSVTVYANSAAPPSLTVVVTNAPDDLKLTVENISSSKKTETKKSKGLRSSYFKIFDSGINSGKTTLHFSSSKKNLDIEVPSQIQNTYSSKILVDYKSSTITADLTSRRISLALLRLTLTLIIEGAIFYILGFREKKSWLWFFIINLVTQGFLNFYIFFKGSQQSYWLMDLIIAEVIITVVEVALYLSLIKEKKAINKVITAILANIASFAFGAYIFSVLPL